MYVCLLLTNSRKVQSFSSLLQLYFISFHLLYFSNVLKIKVLDFFSKTDSLGIPGKSSLLRNIYLESIPRTTPQKEMYQELHMKIKKALRIRVPKVPFNVFDKLKTEIQKFIIRFSF